MYLDEKSVFYAVNTIIAFQIGRFLNNMSAKNISKALCQYQINTYLSLLDIITHDISINFDFMAFCAKVKILDIVYHQILIEIY